MKFFLITFLFTASSLLAQSQPETASEQECSPLMMFSSWGATESSGGESERQNQSHQERIRYSGGASRSGEASASSSSITSRGDFSVGMRENDTDTGASGIELVTFVHQDLAGARRRDLLVEQELQQQKETGFEAVLQSFIQPFAVGDRLPQLGEDSKLLAVFNKYRNLFLAAYEKRGRQLPLLLSYQNIMMDCQRGLEAGAKAASAPAGSFERNAWSNVVMATKKLLSLKVPLIAADAVKNLEELERLAPLVKAYEGVVDLRLQIIDAFKKGRTDVVQRLMTSDLSDIAGKIEEYQSLQRAVRGSHRSLADEYKKIIKTYEEMLKSRKENARALLQGAVFPEVSQAWLDVEKSYLMLIDWQVISLKVIRENQERHSYFFIERCNDIAATHKQAVTYRIDAARAAAMGHLEKASHCSEAAAVCEKLTGVRNPISDLNWSQQLLRFSGLSDALRELANQQLLLNKVLSPEINGMRSWKSREASDFKKRLVAVSPGLCKKVLNGIGEEELQGHLIHDLEVTQKKVDAATNSLGLGDVERAPAIRQRLEGLWTKAAECYGNYSYDKSRFYAAYNSIFNNEWNKTYFLKRAECFEKEGDCYMRAIEVLQTDDENREAMASRWLEIASLRNLMKVEHDDEIDDCRNLPFPAWQTCEAVISLRTQVIEAILRGDPTEVIAALDHEAQQREPAARVAMNAVQQVADARYQKRLQMENNSGVIGAS